MTAKVGRDNTKYERTMEREGCGTINENGERLVEFCTNYDLVIGGTLFPQRYLQGDPVLFQRKGEKPNRPFHDQRYLAAVTYRCQSEERS